MKSGRITDTLDTSRAEKHVRPASSNVLKNSFFILLSRGIQFLSSFFIVVAVTRYLSVEQYGVYSFLAAFVSSIMALSYFGIQQVLIREIAQNKITASQTLGAAIQLRTSLSIVAVTIVLVSFYFMKLPAPIIVAGVVAIMSEFFLSFSMLPKSVFQAFEKMKYEPVIMLIHCLVLSLSVAVVIYFNMGFVWLFIAAAVANMIQLAMSLYILSSRFLHPTFTLERSIFRQFFKDVLVIGIGIFFYQNMFRLNVLLLKWFGNVEDVSFFNAPHSLIMQIQIIPLSLMIAIFPLFSRLMHSDREKLAKIYEKLLRFLFIFSTLAGVSLFSFSKEIITTVFGDKYFNSVPALMIISWAIIPLTLDMLTNGVLIAMNKQKYSIIYAGLALALNSFAALIFMPTYGFIAAAYLSLFSYTFLCICSLYFIGKNGLPVRLEKTVGKTFAAVIIGAIIFVLLKPVSIVLSLFVGTSFYFGAILFMRAFTIDELMELTPHLRRRQNNEGQETL